MGFFIDMNNKRIYDALCERGKCREKGNGIYYELHHIIPRCMGGSNKQHNLTLLTYREHVICHWLLHRMHPNHEGLGRAFAIMVGMANSRSDYTPSSRMLTEAKQAHAKAMADRDITPWNFIHHPETNEVRHLEKGKRLPVGWKWGRGFSTTTNMVRIYNINTHEASMISDGDKLPVGWDFGMPPSFTKKRKKYLSGYKWAHNPNTEQKKQIFDGKLPHGWEWGRGKNKPRKTKFIHNKSTMEWTSIDKNKDMPSGWEDGIGYNNRCGGRSSSDWTKVELNF